MMPKNTSWFALVVVFITSMICGAPISTNGIPELIKSALPENMKIAPPYGHIQRAGHLGHVTHYYIGIFDQKNTRKINTHENIDAFFVLVPGDYTFPDKQTETAYSKYFLTRTAKFQAFLLAPMNTDPVWEQLRTKLKEALDH